MCIRSVGYKLSIRGAGYKWSTWDVGCKRNTRGYKRNIVYGGGGGVPEVWVINGI